MKFKHIHFIINPASGQSEPILSLINDTFKDTDITWEVSVTKKAKDASHLAQLILDKTELIAVYGGDGSVSEVAQVLMRKETPMAIIPGGTANVMSKELGIPQSTVSAIELLKSDRIECINLDVGLVNNIPFLIRLNFGIMADMVLEADRELKNKVGQLAYGIKAIQTMIKSDNIKYHIKVNGEEVFEEGVALTVTNCGSIGIGNYSFLPEISVSDGYFDVILLKQADLMSVLRVAGTTLLKTESDVLKHWKSNRIKIHLEQPTKIILDDFEMEAQDFDIEVIANALKVVVPSKSANNES